MFGEESVRKRTLESQHDDDLNPKRAKVLEEGNIDDALLGELESLYQDIDKHIEPKLIQDNIPKRNRHQPYKDVPVPRYGNRSLRQGTLNLHGRISREQLTDEQIIPQAREAPIGYVPPPPTLNTTSAPTAGSPQNTAKQPVIMPPISPISDDENKNRIPLEISDTLPPPSFPKGFSQDMKTPMVKHAYIENPNDTMQQQKAMHAQMQQQQKQMKMMQQLQMRQYYQQMMQAQMMQNPAYQAQMMQYYKQRKQAQQASIMQNPEGGETLTVPASMNMGCPR